MPRTERNNEKLPTFLFFLNFRLYTWLRPIPYIQKYIIYRIALVCLLLYSITKCMQAVPLIYGNIFFSLRSYQLKIENKLMHSHNIVRGNKARRLATHIHADAVFFILFSIQYFSVGRSRGQKAHLRASLYPPINTYDH